MIFYSNQYRFKLYSVCHFSFKTSTRSLRSGSKLKLNRRYSQKGRTFPSLFDRVVFCVNNFCEIFKINLIIPPNNYESETRSALFRRTAIYYDPVRQVRHLAFAAGIWSADVVLALLQQSYNTNFNFTVLEIFT